jgi:hypothetical protein
MRKIIEVDIVDEEVINYHIELVLFLNCYD